MTKNVIDHYNAYTEDNRLEKDNYHRIEFITTVKILDDMLSPNSKILDVAAGTGAYSFYLAEKGHLIESRDIVPRHVEIMKEKAKTKGTSNISFSTGDARDLSAFEAESFDAVLCMGPIYHLLSEDERRSCISECLRVLKKDGILAVAYINKYAALAYEVIRDRKNLNNANIENLLSGTSQNPLMECFHFTNPGEIEDTMAGFNTCKLLNTGVDGIACIMAKTVNNFSEDEFHIWLDYHFKTCTEPSILGYSMHGLYICSKNK